MNAGRYTVTVVLDPEFGTRLSALVQNGPVWIVNSPFNRLAIEQVWTEFPQKSHIDGVTAFDMGGASNPEDILINEIDTIDLHHGSYSANPPYSVLKVIGTPLSERIQTAFAEFGFDQFVTTDEGFRAIRSGVQDTGVQQATMPTAAPTSQMQTLIDAALAVAEKAYAPYSNFRVGSALLLTNGETVTGTNVENVSYGLTICAERSALVRAIAQFGPQIRIAAAAVVNLNDSPSPPCGACRQVLAEFIEPDAPISFPAGSKGQITTVTLPFREVMPYASDLKLK